MYIKSVARILDGDYSSMKAYIKTIVGNEEAEFKLVPSHADQLTSFINQHTDKYDHKEAFVFFQNIGAFSEVVVIQLGGITPLDGEQIGRRMEEIEDFYTKADDAITKFYFDLKTLLDDGMSLLEP